MRSINLSVVTLLASATALAAAGCRQEVESTDIRTSGVYPEIEITASGSGSSRADVRLKVGGRASNTFLDLTGEDTLAVTAGGTTKTLDSTGGVTYSASFPTEAAGPFVTAFLRGPEDDSAPASTVNLPPPFKIAIASTQISRAAGDLTFTWDPIGGSGDMDMSLTGRCIRPIIEATPDDGAATVSRDRIQTHESTRDESCTVTLTLARKQSGQVDPAFTEGGNVVARQIRTATFTSAP